MKIVGFEINGITVRQEGNHYALEKTEKNSDVNQMN